MISHGVPPLGGIKQECDGEKQAIFGVRANTQKTPKDTKIHQKRHQKMPKDAEGNT